jgi:hypothetical protein
MSVPGAVTATMPSPPPFARAAPQVARLVHLLPPSPALPAPQATISLIVPAAHALLLVRPAPLLQDAAHAPRAITSQEAAVSPALPIAWFAQTPLHAPHVALATCCPLQAASPVPPTATLA